MEMARIFLFVASLVVADGWIPGMSLRHGHQHHYHHAYTGDSAIYRMLRLMKPAHPPHNPVYHHPHPPPPPHDAPLIQPSVEDSQSMRNPGMHSPHPHADPGSRMYSGGETMQLFFLILVFVVRLFLDHPNSTQSRSALSRSYT